MMRRIGVDIGGTHADVVVIGDDKVRFHKVSSNNVDPTEAVVRALDEMELSLTETEFSRDDGRDQCGDPA
jgi:N-methylhydantoinase A/oxoprolinase/acetone carboxylase beta subunit